MRLFDFDPSLLFDVGSVSLKFKEGLKSVEGLNKFFLFLVQVVFKGVNLLAGDREFIRLVFLEFFNHGLIVQN